jgi:hypothetical protein
MERQDGCATIEDRWEHCRRGGNRAGNFIACLYGDPSKVRSLSQLSQKGSFDLLRLIVIASWSIGVLAYQQNRQVVVSSFSTAIEPCEVDN